MSGKIVRLRHPKIVRNATSGAKGRQRNEAYRVREHLTEAEMDKLLAGHASITNTVRYTAMSPEPFKDIWR